MTTSRSMSAHRRSAGPLVHVLLHGAGDPYVDGDVPAGTTVVSLQVR